MLVLPRSFSSLIGTMLGQHPQMYALPETHLFGCNSVSEWSDKSSRQSFNMSHGLFRAVAQLRFGAQDEGAVVQARGWLKRRPELTTGFLLELLAEMVSPRVLIEKSPSLVYSIPAMQQSYTMFPLARYIHVVQHPSSYGEAVMNAISDAARSGPVPKWMVELACYPASSPVDGDLHQQTPMLDPQTGWYALNMNVCSFLESVPESQKMRVRGEELLAVPDTILPRNRELDWRGLGRGRDRADEASRTVSVRVPRAAERTLRQRSRILGAPAIYAGIGRLAAAGRTAAMGAGPNGVVAPSLGAGAHVRLRIGRTLARTPRHATAKAPRRHLPSGSSTAAPRGGSGSSRPVAGGCVGISPMTAGTNSRGSRIKPKPSALR